MSQCPNCGFKMADDIDICPKCAFDFNSVLACPYKISLRCIYNNTKCYVEGLNFEDCGVYLTQCGISSFQ